MKITLIHSLTLTCEFLSIPHLILLPHDPFHIPRHPSWPTPSSSAESGEWYPSWNPFIFYSSVGWSLFITHPSGGSIFDFLVGRWREVHWPLHNGSNLPKVRPGISAFHVSLLNNTWHFVFIRFPKEVHLILTCCWKGRKITSRP